MYIKFFHPDYASATYYFKDNKLTLIKSNSIWLDNQQITISKLKEFYNGSNKPNEFYNVACPDYRMRILTQEESDNLKVELL